MIPRTHIDGWGGATWFWPMGLGGPPPRAMERPAAPTWRYELHWNGDQLRCSRQWNDNHPDPVVTQHEYRWDGDRIAEIATCLDYGDGTEPELVGRDVWWWDGDRPREVRYVSGQGLHEGHAQLWTWDDAGQRARITCNAGGSRMAQSVVYDAEWRLVRVERERTVAGHVDASLTPDGELELVIEVAWNDGRLVAARGRRAEGPDEEISFVWDGGRLVEQRGAHAAIYRYAEEP